MTTLKLVVSLISALALFSPGISGAAETYTPSETELIKDLGREAIQELVKSFAKDAKNSNIAVSRAAVLPIQKDLDRGYFTLQIENEFSRLSEETGIEIYTRADKSMAMILSEIEWNDSYVDALDPATIQKFGSLKGADAVILTRVDVTRMDDGTFNVRANLQVGAVETGQNLWGDEAATRSLPVVTNEQVRFYLIIAGSVILALILLGLLRSAIRKARRPR